MYGQEILKLLATLPAGQNAAVLLRHAQRHPLNSTTDPSRALLTEEGKAASLALGKSLRGFAHLRLFHSPVPRCRQTAECIAEGAAAQGMHIEISGPRDRLGFVCTKNEAAALSLYTALGEGFIAHWLSGKLAPGIMEEPELTVRENLRELCASLDEATTLGPRLDIHVSHDWNIMVMRELLIGVRHEEAGWLDFLDGLVFHQPDACQLSVRFGEAQRQAAKPWTDFYRR